MAGQDRERDRKREFRHPEVVAYSRSLSAAEAALNRPVIRRRMATTESPGHGGSAARSLDLLPRPEREPAATVVDPDAVGTALR